MGIGQLILSNGHTSSHNSYLGGNAFEALVGALYLDHGYNACMKFMKQQVLGKLINIDKVAYKEVNFKSKLIEWSQKNKVKMEFKLIENQKDKQGSPTFHFQVVMEGIPCGEGHGYSKKESQQEASKLTPTTTSSGTSVHRRDICSKGQPYKDGRGTCPQCSRDFSGHELYRRF